jgi:hypothetical protein|tara:strand:- start:3221 stop:3712 length:492 start_codon:yes stop_codon:yes gene_type:complete
MSEYTQDQQPRGGFGRRNTDRVATARLAVNQGDGNRKGVNPVGLNAVLAYAKSCNLTPGVLAEQLFYRMLTTEDVAKVLNIPTQQLNDMRKTQLGPKWYKFGTSMAGAVRYDPDEVNEWQEKRKMQVQFDSIADAQEFISNLALRYSLTADDLEQLKGEHTNG